MNDDAAPSFGAFIKERRENMKDRDSAYSLRQVAERIGVEPSYLSKLERDEATGLSEEKLRLLAEELELDPDVLLALAGKVSADLRQAIIARPRLFADLIRELKGMPDDAVLRIVREVRDGGW